MPPARSPYALPPSAPVDVTGGDATRHEQLQRTVLALLIKEYHGRLCSTKQLARHLPGPQQARHAISQLRQAGLVHTIGDHTHASLAARTYHQLHT